MAETPLVLGAVLYSDFELLDLYGPLEMFGSVGPELEIVTVAAAAGPVVSAQGPTSLAETSFENCPALDMILLPGGIGTLAALNDDALLSFLRARSAEASTTMSVCSGSAILAKAGLLDGRKATSNKMFFSLATSQSDQVDWIEAARWVVDGPMVTSSGVSAGIDMALAVIEQRFGSERAEQIAIMTEYEWHRDPSWDPFVAYLNQAVPPT